MTMIRTVGLLAGAATLSASGLAGATDIDSASIDALRAELSELRAQNESLEARVDAKDDAWLNETRTTEIRGIVQDVLADSQTRTSLQDSGAMAGYKAGQGFFLSSQDGSFSMRISGQIQTRWVMSHVGGNITNTNTGTLADPVVNAGENNYAWGFQVRRAKVRFQGNVIDKTWHYQVNGDFMEGAQTGTFNLQEAMITHDVNDNLSVTFGRYKAPFTREELVSSSNQLAVERSLVNEYFNADRAVGVDVLYKTDSWTLEGAFNNGAQTAYTSNPGDDNAYTSSANNPTKWAVQGRFQYKLSGDWSDFDSFTSSPDDENAMMFGIAGMAQQYNGNFVGNVQPAASIYDGSSVWGVTADFSAKFAGFSLFGAAVYQNFQAKNGNGSDSNSVNPWGFVGQAGYSFTDQWEVFGRFSWANNRGLAQGAVPVENSEPTEAKLSLLTLGVNYFINENVKFTADWGINLNNSLSGAWVNQADTGWRTTDSSSEWVLRAQLQLLF
jgi:outer membrane murein-binding lipoprotein Lpp